MNVENILHNILGPTNIAMDLNNVMSLDYQIIRFYIINCSMNIFFMREFLKEKNIDVMFGLEEVHFGFQIFKFSD